jgi:hypothetical protein
MIGMPIHGRNSSCLQAFPRGPGWEMIVELSQRGQRPIWQAGNPDDAKAIAAIKQFDVDDRYVVIQVSWEWPCGFLWHDMAYVTRFYRYNRHGKQPWNPMDLGVLVNPQPSKTQFG